MKRQIPLAVAAVVVAIVFWLGILAGAALTRTTPQWTRCVTSPRTNTDLTVDIVYLCQKDSTVVVLEDVPPLLPAQQLPRRDR